SASSTVQLTIVVASGLSITTPTALPGAAENAAYSQTLAATGGQSPYSWAVAVGTLPAGLSLDPATGVISGLPSPAGSYSFIIQVTDTQPQTVQKAFTLTVSGRINIVTPAVLPNASVRVSYTQTFVATGGAPPYTWQLAPGGAPPIGITIDPSG